MPIIKDANYWKEYNQKRKEYLLQKQRERRKQVVDRMTASFDKVVDNNSQVVIKDSCIQPMNTTKPVVIKKENNNDYNLNTTSDHNSKVNTTDYNQKEKVVITNTTEKCIQPNLQPCQNCIQLKEQLEKQKVNLANNNTSCSLNHYSFSQLFSATSEQLKKDYQQIYSQHPQTARKCFDCYNLETNYQIMRKLLDDYAKSKKG